MNPKENVLNALINAKNVIHQVNVQSVKILALHSLTVNAQMALMMTEQVNVNHVARNVRHVNQKPNAKNVLLLESLHQNALVQKVPLKTKKKNV